MQPWVPVLIQIVQHVIFYISLIEAWNIDFNEVIYKISIITIVQHLFPLVSKNTIPFFFRCLIRIMNLFIVAVPLQLTFEYTVNPSNISANIDTKLKSCSFSFVAVCKLLAKTSWVQHNLNH